MEWISVKEEFPTNKLVLIYGLNEYGKHRTLRAFFAPKFTIKDDGNYSGDTDYDEKSDTWYWPEGWYECNEREDTHWLVPFQPSHWMPLPSPPNEKQE